MLVLTKYDAKKHIAEILDTDDLVIEYVDRDKLNDMACRGLDVCNIDNKVLVEYPHTRIVLSPFDCGGMVYVPNGGDEMLFTFDPPLYERDYKKFIDSLGLYIDIYRSDDDTVIESFVNGTYYSTQIETQFTSDVNGNNGKAYKINGKNYFLVVDLMKYPMLDVWNGILSVVGYVAKGKYLYIRTTVLELRLYKDYACVRITNRGKFNRIKVEPKHMSLQSFKRMKLFQ